MGYFCDEYFITAFIAFYSLSFFLYSNGHCSSFYNVSRIVACLRVGAYDIIQCPTQLYIHITFERSSSVSALVLKIGNNLFTTVCQQPL